ncbi:ornithine cyclodeaminase family protein [Wenxinia marina]|uniref:Putative ornithine cyclodeaminase, mu-crystallin-like protein n=1 Tax=Wenxinia marina DSM 24838 TaxID=1123501 RepID=A0A0D0PFM7_9RHOB|nr:ornithine cyclodeaminase family protein [Wenxinia marina]KIQ70141.1 putative ornithine cyclodeaminase, mu-crystallin-like protein [Wenxinia marina DSM 24838]GGL80649.1 hypothetical protein GCM10011392_39090 [Wenxinia marina]
MPLILDNDAVARLVSPADVVTALDRAYRAYAASRSLTAPRLDFQSPQTEGGRSWQLGLAAGLGPDRWGCLRVKSDVIYRRVVDGRPRKEKYCVEPGTYMGLLMVFDMTDGALRAIVHDGLIQQMRVGADSALGVRYMAREDAATLGILGAGGMARTHIDAILQVRPIRRVRIYAPTRANSEALAAEARARQGVDAEAMDSAEAAVRDADILSACTNAIGPVVPGAALDPGTHVTCIGGTLDAVADGRIDRALRFGTASGPLEVPDWAVEDEGVTFALGGEKAGAGTARRFHAIPRDRRVMFADLLADPSRGRTDDSQITFSERGNIHGAQFAALAGLIVERAAARGEGVVLDDALFLQTIRN